jgi:hypothetical protein
MHLAVEVDDFFVFLVREKNEHGFDPLPFDFALHPAMHMVGQQVFGEMRDEPKHHVPRIHIEGRLHHGIEPFDQGLPLQIGAMIVAVQELAVEVQDGMPALAQEHVQGLAGAIVPDQGYLGFVLPKMGQQFMDGKFPALPAHGMPLPEPNDIFDGKMGQQIQVNRAGVVMRSQVGIGGMVIPGPGADRRIRSERWHLKTDLAFSFNMQQTESEHRLKFNTISSPDFSDVNHVYGF